MAGKSTKPNPKKIHSHEQDKQSADFNPNEESTLLEIKREINTTLKDLFEDLNYRISKVESSISLRDQKELVEYPKAPAYCYN